MGWADLLAGGPGFGPNGFLLRPLADITGQSDTLLPVGAAGWLHRRLPLFPALL